jgi:hypothetical protein
MHEKTKLLFIFAAEKQSILMSLLNQQNDKNKKKGNKKNGGASTNQGSKFIQKPKSGGFVSKQANTGSQRGS